jgi:hypothetical protein
MYEMNCASVCLSKINPALVSSSGVFSYSRSRFGSFEPEDVENQLRNERFEDKKVRWLVR